MEKKKNLKKKKLDNEKVKRILKIVGYGAGLTLCAAAFVTLLVVGVRGCASTPRSTEPTSAVIRKETNKERIRKDGIFNANSNLYFIKNNVSYVVSDFIAGSSTIGDYGEMQLQIPYYVVSDNDTGDIVINERYDYFTYTYSRSSSGHSFRYWVTRDSDIPDDNITFGFTINGNSVIYQGDKDLFLHFYNGGVLDYLTRNVSEYENYTNDRERATYSMYANLLSFLEKQRKGINVDINFNEVINPFGPVLQNFDYFADGKLQGAYDVWKGLFQLKSTGEYFSGVKVHYITGNGTRYGTATDYNTNNNTNSYQYMTLGYVRPNGTELIVNAQDYATTTSGSAAGNGVLILSNHWISSLYRNIRVLYSFDGLATGLPSKDMNGIEVLSTLNNNSASSGVIINGGSGVINNPFDLIKTAFGSLVPLLNVYLWPGVTIGILVFIPFIVSIVLFVVWLFKR